MLGVQILFCWLLISTAFRFLQLIDQDSQVAPFSRKIKQKNPWWFCYRLCLGAAVTPCLFDQGLRVFHGDKLLDFTVYLNSGGEWEYDFHHFGARERDSAHVTWDGDLRKEQARFHSWGVGVLFATEKGFLTFYRDFRDMMAHWIPVVHFGILKFVHFLSEESMSPWTFFRCPFSLVIREVRQLKNVDFAQAFWLLS